MDGSETWSGRFGGDRYGEVRLDVYEYEFCMALRWCITWNASITFGFV
jgi:hypothetical protein